MIYQANASNYRLFGLRFFNELGELLLEVGDTQTQGLFMTKIEISA